MSYVTPKDSGVTASFNHDNTCMSSLSTHTTPLLMFLNFPVLCCTHVMHCMCGHNTVTYCLLSYNVTSQFVPDPERKNTLILNTNIHLNDNVWFRFHVSSKSRFSFLHKLSNTQPQLTKQTIAGQI